MDRQEEQTPKPNVNATEALKIIGITPEEAQKRLEGLGYAEKDWVIFTEQGLGSHWLRALAYIAKGSEPRKIEDVYEELFPGEHRGPFPKEKVQTPNRLENINKSESPKEIIKESLNSPINLKTK